MKINKHYLDVKDSYLFAETGRKIAEYKAAHPQANVTKAQHRRRYPSAVPGSY